MVCLLKELDVHGTRDEENPSMVSFDKRPSCQGRSKVLKMSNEIRCFSPWMSSEADQIRRKPVDRPLNGKLVVAQ